MRAVKRESFIVAAVLAMKACGDPLVDLMQETTRASHIASEVVNGFYSDFYSNPTLMTDGNMYSYYENFPNCRVG